jgi:hypothetical protein
LTRDNKITVRLTALEAKMLWLGASASMDEGGLDRLGWQLPEVAAFYRATATVATARTAYAMGGAYEREEDLDADTEDDRDAQ